MNLSKADLDLLETEIFQKRIVKARTCFYTFVKLLAPTILPEEFVDGRHLEFICEQLEDVVDSVENVLRSPRRLQLFMPPGSMKSKIASNLFPAWCLGRNPNWCFLAIGSDLEFAIDNFGRPTKDVIDSPQYRSVFPNTVLKRDVQASGRWDTTRKGRFVAKGVGQSIAGRRAHISICDDVINEWTTDNDRQAINGWYQKGLRTRLLPRGAEIIINTRWFVEDLSGYMLKKDSKSARPWEVIELPAILDEPASAFLREGLPPEDKRFAVGTSFWPEFWPTELLLEKKSTMQPSEWAALYQQKPVSDETGLIKRTDFQVWSKKDPPKCRYVVVSIDTALSQKDAANFSAYTVWGVFTNIIKSLDTDVAQDSMILLAAGKGRWDLTELCSKARELDTTYAPEYFLVEETSAGLLLIPEMQKRGHPVLPFKPKGDKTSRLQATTPYFQAGRIYVPSGKTWAEEVVTEVISFQPRLKNQVDDYTDTVSQAVIWMRDNYKIDNDGYSNHWDEEVMTQRRQTYWSSMMSGTH